MADIEHEFISALIRNHDMLPVTDARITGDHFSSAQHRRVWDFALDYNLKYGQLPSARAVKANFPDYKIYAGDDPLAYHVDELTQQYLQRELQLRLADMSEFLEDNDPRAALEILQSSVGELTLLGSKMVDDDLTKTWEDRLTEYEEYRENKGSLRGISTGFPTIDRATMGYQPGQFIVIIGLPKSGKSTLLLATAIAAHLQGKTVLFIGFEMSNNEQGARYDSQVARIDHLRLMTGEIGTLDIKKLEKAGAARENMNPFIVSADIASATTLSGVAAKMDQYKPDLVCIDGLYLMDDEYGEPKGSPAALTNISRGVKKLAQLKGIPIVGTTQALHSKVSRSQGLTANSGGYTSAWAQDCDLMMGTEAVEDEPTIQKLKSLANRIGPLVECEIEWDWSTGTFAEMDEEDDEVDAA